jgi:hypothetical protein
MFSSRVRFAVLALILAIVVAAAAFVVKDGEPEAPPDAAQAPTPTATVSPLPPLQLERLPVRWTPVPDVFDFDAAVEKDDPFAGLFSDAPPEWSVHVVDGDEAPREVLRTERWVRDVSWGQDGLQVQTQTKRDVPSTLGTVTAVWEVTTTIDARAGRTGDAYAALPVSGCTLCERRGPSGSFGAGVTLEPSPDGGSMLVELLYDQGISDPSRPPFLLQEAYLVDADGRSRRLEGLPDVSGVGWLPTGKTISGSGGPVFGAHGDRYLIPPEDGEAVVLRESLGLAFRRGGGNPPRTDDPRAVFAFYDAAGPQGPGNYLGVYNTATDEAWLLGAAPGAVSLSSSRPPAIALDWPEGSERVVAGFEPDSVLIDPGTGARQAGTRNDLLPDVPLEVRSPDGRHVAYFEDREQVENPDPACDGLPYRLNARDERTGRTKTLLECDTDTGGRLAWLSNTKLIVRAYDCSSCGHPRATLLVVDIESGKTVRLTDEPRAGLNAYGSPDGKKVAATDDAGLRVFDSGGRLVRDYGAPPDGWEYSKIVWSPDSGSFAYVLVPEEFVIGV